MGAIDRRLRRLEKAMRNSDPFAYLKRMTDAELEGRVVELHQIMEAKALDAGNTVEEFRAALASLYVENGRTPPDWSIR